MSDPHFLAPSGPLPLLGPRLVPVPGIFAMFLTGGIRPPDPPILCPEFLLPDMIELSGRVPRENSSRFFDRLRYENIISEQQRDRLGTLRRLVATTNSAGIRRRAHRAIARIMDHGKFPLAIFDGATGPDAVVLNQSRDYLNPAWEDHAPRKERRDLSRWMQSAQADGKVIYEAVCTMEVREGDKLHELLSNLGATWKKFANNYRTLSSAANSGRLRYLHLEWSQGTPNGLNAPHWHVHFHVLIFHDPLDAKQGYRDEERIQERLQDSWETAVRTVTTERGDRRTGSVRGFTKLSRDHKLLWQRAAYLLNGILTGKKDHYLRFDELPSARAEEFIHAMRKARRVSGSRKFRSLKNRISKGFRFGLRLGKRTKLKPMCWLDWTDKLQRAKQGYASHADLDCLRRNFPAVYLSLWLHGHGERAKKLSRTYYQIFRHEYEMRAFHRKQAKPPGAGPMISGQPPFPIPWQNHVGIG